MKPYFEHCPACGLLPGNHNDSACEFRYSLDGSGWIAPANFNPDSLFQDEE